MAPRYPGKKPSVEGDPLDMLYDVLLDMYGDVPLIGDFLEVITGKEDGDLNDLGTWINQLRRLLSGENVTGLLPSLVGIGINGLFSMVNQIGEIFNGLVVTPINSLVSGVKDWFGNLLGWRQTTTAKHQELTNQVWSGATTAPVLEDRTEEEVRQAVAAMKARSEALQHENELRYRSAVPLWQGPIPGGDVTVTFESVNTRDNWIIPVTGTSGGQGLPPHNHGSGSYQVDLGLGNPVATSPVSQGVCNGVMAATRAHSDVSRNMLSFLCRAVGSITQAYASVYVYDEKNDVWLCVAVTDNFISQVPLFDSYGWVHAQLLEEYTPSMTDLWAVRWSTVGTGNLMVACGFSTAGVAGAWDVPATDFVPYGRRIMATGPAVPTVGNQLSLTGGVGWSSSRVPFVQLAPDLGQAFQPKPQHWFDDFNTNSLAQYSTYRTGGGDVRITGGDFRFNGVSTGQAAHGIWLRKQMATDRIRVEATARKLGDTNQPCWIYIGQNASGRNGVLVQITDTVVGFGTNDGPNPLEGGTPRGSISHTRGADGRWAVEFFPDTSEYKVFHNGDFMHSWQDLGNLAKRGRGNRGGGLAVYRAGLIVSANGPAWDNLLIHDVTDPDPEDD